MFTGALTLLLAWGVFAFGAVYPWAYWPLLAGAFAIGVAALLTRRDEGAVPVGLCAALAATAAGVAAQLIPLPVGVLSALTPATVGLLRRFDLVFAAGSATHPLTIDPSATAVTLACLVVLTVLLIGATQMFSSTGVRSIGAAICILGTIVALVTIVQRAVNHTDRIYGLWMPEQSRSFYGPFVNKNHFAGWMIMAMSVALAYFGGRLARTPRNAKRGWREALLWWSSPAANELLLIAFALVVMGISLLMSVSRSGVLCALLAIGVTALTIARRQASRARKMVGIGFLAFTVVAVAGWVGTEAIGKRFAGADAEWSGGRGRVGAWADAWSVVRAVPLTGTGMNTYGDAMLFYQRHVTAVHFAQAHNDYLQIAAEGGLLVLVPAAIAVALLIVHVRRRFAADDPRSMSYWVRIGAATGLVAIALQEAVDFSLQMPGNALLFTVLCAIALHRPRIRSHTHVHAA